MPTAEFFKQFGLIAFKNFLDRDFCELLCSEISRSSKQPGVFRSLQTGEDVLDENIKRRSEATGFSTEMSSTIAKKLEDLISTIEDQYEVQLKGVQTPKFCVYKAGDFYRYHTDSGDGKHMAAEAKQRKVSAIIFLNEESQIAQKGTYCGGNLTFYGLMENETFGKFGLPLVGEKGMLITFPPTLGHEVTPVKSGERYTIATWFI